MSETIETHNEVDWVYPNVVTVYGGPCDGHKVLITEHNKVNQHWLFFFGDKSHNYEVRWMMTTNAAGRRRCTYCIVWPKMAWNLP